MSSEQSESMSPVQPEPEVAAGEDSAQAELDEIKIVVLDSAELATRAATLATNAGTDMRTATEMMIKTHGKQRKQSLILLITSGVLMLITACIFAGVSVTLFSRLKMVDAMLLAVGKRVTELDGTMESVASVNEALQTLTEHQEDAQKQQEKLEARLDEVVKTTQQVPEAAGKQIEEKGQALIKQVQAMESRLQAQASALNQINQQVKAVQGQIRESGQNLKTEVEAMGRQQRERQAAETRAATQKIRERETAVQYPRLPVPGAPASPLSPASKP